MKKKVAVLLFAGSLITAALAIDTAPARAGSNGCTAAGHSHSVYMSSVKDYTSDVTGFNWDNSQYRYYNGVFKFAHYGYTWCN